MATIVRMGPDGKITLGKMTKAEESELYGKVNEPALVYVRRRKEELLRARAEWIKKQAAKAQANGGMPD